MRKHHPPASSSLAASVLLPITVYAFDRRAKKYMLVDCLQCAVPCATPPRVLNCNAGMGLLVENLELLKAAMQTPAIVLRHGTTTKALNASGDEVATLPPTQRIRIIKAYEMMCLNIATHITHYRLRADGALMLVDQGEVNCVMCYVPESLAGLNVVRTHLRSRANSIRKVLRDRRIVVELGAGRTCVYSTETLQRRSVLVDGEKGEKASDAPLHGKRDSGGDHNE